MTSFQEESLSSLWAEASVLIEKSDSGDTEARAKAASTLERLKKAIERESIFSSNESVDDVDTEDLHLVTVDYYLGHVLLSMPFKAPAERLAALEKSEASMYKFLLDCERYGLVGKEDLESIREMESGSEGDLPPGRARERKIGRLRRQQASSKKMGELKEELRSVLDQKSSDPARAVREEGLKREVGLLKVESLAREALNEMSTSSREKEMLARMVQMAGVANPDQEADMRVRRSVPEEEANRKGLEVTHISKVNGELEMKRETIRANIFKPTVAPPTMTVEEYGEIAYKKAMERAEREKNAPKPDRRYKQLVEDGDEDNEELVDIASKKDRDWDDWKEDNPKGWGNKANKRF